MESEVGSGAGDGISTRSPGLIAHPSLAFDLVTSGDLAPWSTWRTGGDADPLLCWGRKFVLYVISVIKDGHRWGCRSVGQSIGPSRRWRRFDSPVRRGIFLPESTFSADSLTCVRTPMCANACVNICAHVKDPVVHVRVRWIMETLKHPACAVGWVARLCRSWLSPRKAARIFPWEKSHWDNTVVKNIVKID